MWPRAGSGLRAFRRESGAADSTKPKNRKAEKPNEAEKPNKAE